MQQNCAHNFDGPYTWPFGQTGIKAKWVKNYCRRCGLVTAQLHDLNPPKEITDQPLPQPLHLT